MKNIDKVVVNRRNFLRFTSLSGAALILGIPSVSAENTALSVANLSEAADFFNLNPYIIIEKSGEITLFNTKPDMGQGTFQSIPALIAEELELAPDQYTVKQSGGEASLGQAQFSGGSFSVRASYMELRKVGAAAREMLIAAASKQWGVAASDCYAQNAKIIHKPSGKSLGYGDLVETASKLEAPKEPKLKDPKDFKILGKSVKRADVPLKSSGKAVFGIDVDVPNMVYASVERCPVFGAKLKDFDKSATLKVTGVEQVVAIERDVDGKKYTGVAVVAKNYWAAMKGRKALKVNWDYQGKDSFNTKDYFQSLRDGLKNEGIKQHSQGDFDKVYSESTNKVESVYETPFVTHSTMEPMNCVAPWKEGNKLEIWTSTQAPSMIMGDFPKRFGLKAEDIKVNVTFNGGGFGRRLRGCFFELELVGFF